jgi:hypothetical protein
VINPSPPAILHVASALLLHIEPPPRWPHLVQARFEDDWSAELLRELLLPLDQDKAGTCTTLLSRAAEGLADRRRVLTFRRIREIVDRAARGDSMLD